MVWLVKIFNNWSVVVFQQLDDWKGKVLHSGTSSAAYIYYKIIFYFPISVYSALSRLGLGLNFCANLGHFWSKGTECTTFIQKKGTFSFLAKLLFIVSKQFKEYTHVLKPVSNSQINMLNFNGGNVPNMWNIPIFKGGTCRTCSIFLGWTCWMCLWFLKEECPPILNRGMWPIATNFQHPAYLHLHQLLNWLGCCLSVF